MELAIRHIVQVRKGPIYDGHIHVSAHTSCRNSAQGTAINTNFASESHLPPHISQQGHRICAEVVRTGVVLPSVVPFGGPCQPIAPVVPDQNVDSLLQEEPQVKSVRVVDHMLVEHRIRVAQDKSWFVFIKHSRGFVLKLFTCGGEEHGVKQYVA